MPFSDAEGKPWSLDRVKAYDPSSVLDIGPGQGTYSMLMRQHTDQWCTWDAVEIWEAYVAQFNLTAKYNDVRIADVRDLEAMDFAYDLVIFGDVLEHMYVREAVSVINTAKVHAGAILVSLPIVESIQGAYEGNVHETHHAQWQYEEMHHVMGYGPAFKGQTLGVFWWESA